ncbi:MAG: hypothetical protein ACI8QG_001738 [Flavobacteriales bacterium]
MNIENIIEAMINIDFSIRKPSLIGECFIINHDKGIILSVYDERGMDVIATDDCVLAQLYEKHNACILDYDRERIDTVFK